MLELKSKRHERHTIFSSAKLIAARAQVSQSARLIMLQHRFGSIYNFAQYVINVV